VSELMILSRFNLNHLYLALNKDDSELSEEEMQMINLFARTYTEEY
jgi:hypothetical protein